MFLGQWPIGVPPQQHLPHCPAGATTPALFPLSGDQNGVVSVPRQQCVAWPRHLHPQHPGHASGTEGHSRKFVGHRIILQPVEPGLGDTSPISGFSTIWGVTIGRVDSPLLPLAIEASSKYTVAEGSICKQGLHSSLSNASLIVTE